MNPHKITEKEFSKLQSRVRGGVVGTRRESIGLKCATEQSEASETPVPTGKARALLVRSMPIIEGAGSNPAPSPYKSKLEASYAQYLDVLKHIGEITFWRYEPFGLKLADRTFYHPDFFLMLPNGHIEIHEVKGFRRDDAMVKLKVAAKQFDWWRFVLVSRVRGVWEMREV